MATPNPPKMKRSAWLKTPYAKSTSADPDRSVRSLLAKYGVADIQSTEATAPSGRRLYGVRFRLSGKTYLVSLESLHAEADPEELLRQVKRAVYFLLKALLEQVTVFVSADRVMFPFLEVAGGGTLYDVAAPALAAHSSPDFGRLLLGPAREENDDGPE